LNDTENYYEIIHDSTSKVSIWSFGPSIIMNYCPEASDFVCKGVSQWLIGIDCHPVRHARNADPKGLPEIPKTAWFSIKLPDICSIGWCVEQAYNKALRDPLPLSSIFPT